jgi:integrase
VDHTGKLRTYYRHTRPATPLPGLSWSVEFMAAYDAAKACAGRDKPIVIGAARTIAGSLDAALVKYYASEDFTSMPKDTRANNRAYLEKWRGGDDRGKRPLHQMQHKHVQAYVNKQAGFYAQRNVLRAIRCFTKFCLRTFLIDNDPAAAVVKAKKVGTGGFRAWTEAEVDKYIAKHSLGTKAHLALQIMLCTSLRRSDAIQIGPRHCPKTKEHPHGILADYAPQKTRRTGGKLVSVPLHDDLVAAIAAMPVTGTDTYLVNEHGKPFTPKRFSKCMRAWTDAAGIPPLTDETTGKRKHAASHGLRKLCLTRLAELGLDVFSIAAVSGHKNLAEVQVYVDNYNRKKAAAAAIAALQAAQKRNAVCLNGQDG